MHQILVDYARTHGAAKRGADRLVELDTSVVLRQVRSTDLVALDDALNDLTSLDEQQGRIVELRFFRRAGNGRDCSSAGHFVFDRQTGLECGQGVADPGNLRKGNRGDTRAVAKN